ncbi:MAG: DedA family protein [Bacteroidota bacterium]|nr:DedA family protein [Bacteroidota bacterium]MDP4234152.1 DedA family protein [Bacteroidota bacterium]MDP4244026.1 DedA family protein [Bacteroidota bacterium]MDP4287852.1 DedA family protein [Bacteroidota bacterium]
MILTPDVFVSTGLLGWLPLAHPLLHSLGHPETAKLFDGVLTFLQGALERYGYIIVFMAIMIESMGVPFPGETMLLIAAAYAASSSELSIFGVIGSAAGGAILGDSLGYWIGREGGRKLIRKYGKFVGLTDDRYQKAQDYLKKHGGKAVFFGRFVSIARTWIAVLVGAHHFNYPQFLVYNVLGGIVWATLYGTIGYVFGTNLPLVEKWVSRAGITLTIIAAAVLVYLWYLRKKRKEAKELAEPTAIVDGSDESL